jgi:hypothetical protein
MIHDPCSSSSRASCSHRNLPTAPQVRKTTPLYLLLPAGIPVEVGVDINVPGVRLLAAPLGATAHRDVEVSLGWAERLGEEAAVSTETMALFLKVRSLELNASTRRHTEPAQHCVEQTVLAVGSVLGPKD